MTITAMTPYYGSNRANAELIGKEIGEVAWCGVPFLGSGTELRYIRCRAGVASDLNSHVVNLARVIRDPEKRAAMNKVILGTPFHSRELKEAQSLAAACALTVSVARSNGQAVEPNVTWAAAYFVSAWMTRSPSAGTGAELTGPIAARWTSSGGDSAVRYRSAVEAAKAWGEVLARWTFLELPALDFLARCKDDPDHAVYADPPWPDGPGDQYEFSMTEDDHWKLAEALIQRTRGKTIVRIGDTETARRLYPHRFWVWVLAQTRSQTRGTVREAILIRRPPHRRSAAG